MKIGMIGAGKVGFTLGKFFSQGGVPITGYYSRSLESAQKAAAFTQTQAYNDLQALIKNSDAIFMTVPDQAITTVYQQVCQFEIKNKFLCHCSGALSAQEAFPHIETTGAYGFSIHPLFPISDPYQAYKELPDAFFCLEGNETYLPVFQALLEGLGVQVKIIPAATKVRYHAACVMASNLVCALMQESIELLGDCGFPPQQARSALAPLVRSNLEHLLKVGPERALTGPVERGDEVTIQKHLEHLEGETQALYRQLSRRLIPLASAKNPHVSYDAIQVLLKERQEGCQEERKERP